MSPHLASRARPSCPVGGRFCDPKAMSHEVRREPIPRYWVFRSPERPAKRYHVRGRGKLAGNCGLKPTVDWAAAHGRALSEEIYSRFCSCAESLARPIAANKTVQDSYFQIPPTMVRSTWILISSDGSVLNGS